MKCPYCSCMELKVTNKRDSPKGIRRRRECLKCGKRFTTYETIEKIDLIVFKKDGNKEVFDREKLKRGIMKALEKRENSEKHVVKIIEEIEQKLRKRKSNEIKSSLIGEFVLRKLKKIDPVAFMRFASVCREFEDAKDFKIALKEV